MGRPEFWALMSAIIGAASVIVAFAALLHNIRNKRSGEIKDEIKGVRTELRQELDAVRAELREELGQVKADATTEHDQLAAQVRDINRTIAEHYARRVDIDGELSLLREAVTAASAAIGALGTGLGARIDQLFARVAWRKGE